MTHDPKLNDDISAAMARQLESDQNEAEINETMNLITESATGDERVAHSSTKRIILAAGMPRSGSTWLYNAVRLLLGDNPDLVAGWVDDLARREAALLLVKIHDPSDLADRADLIFTTYRPLAEVAASLGRMGWPNDATAMQQVRDQRAFWGPRSNCDILYSDIINSPGETVSRIASVLGVPNKDIVSELLTMKEPEAGYDPVNLLHRGHRTS